MDADAQNVAPALRYYGECLPNDGDPEKKRPQLAVDEIMSPDFTMYFNCEADARLAVLRRFLDFDTLGAQIEPPPAEM